MTDLVKLAATLAEAHASAKEGLIKQALGLTVRHSIHVEVRRPWWMPDAFYRWLLRTVVVTIRPIEVKP